jgi:signal transduction histidine kinase
MRTPRIPIAERRLDAALAAVWLVALEIEAVALRHHTTSLALSALAVVAMVLPAVWRRRAPLAFTLAVLAAASVYIAAVTDTNGPFLAPLYIQTVPPYVLARYEQPRRAVVGVAVCLAWGAVVTTLTTPGVGNYLGSVVMLGVAWAVGRALRAHRRLNDELARKAERIEAERASRIRLAVADERTRIARELHALVASSVSAMVVQAEAAELLLDGDLAPADKAMAAVEQTGREALSEMRRLLGVLRHAGEEPVLAPQPGVGQVYALIEAARAGGRSVELRVEGEPGPLPASVDLGVYRILEDALASSADAVAVTLRFGEHAVELEVFTPSPKTSAPWPTLAMRERVAICDGTLRSDATTQERRLLATLPRAFEEVFA